MLVLDQITDPHNVGAILRTAAGFDVGGRGHHRAPQPGSHRRAGEGGLRRAGICADRHRAEPRARDGGAEGARLPAGRPRLRRATSISATCRCAPRSRWCSAPKAEGLRQLTRETCDHVARLDLPGRIKSLNVSNAAALALYVASRRRAARCTALHRHVRPAARAAARDTAAGSRIVVADIGIARHPVAAPPPSVGVDARAGIDRALIDDIDPRHLIGLVDDHRRRRRRRTARGSSTASRRSPMTIEAAADSAASAAIERERRIIMSSGRWMVSGVWPTWRGRSRDCGDRAAVVATVAPPDVDVGRDDHRRRDCRRIDGRPAAAATRRPTRGRSSAPAAAGAGPAAARPRGGRSRDAVP